MIRQQYYTDNDLYDFVNYVIEKFPFRIHTIRTDRGHEFQAQFHWHVEDPGIRHVDKTKITSAYGKVERSHRTDKDEFYQLLSNTDDVDLNEKLTAWETFITSTDRMAPLMEIHLMKH